jgi:hypothetical protein
LAEHDRPAVTSSPARSPARPTPPTARSTSRLCVRRGSDRILCGIRDDASDPPISNITNLGIVEFVRDATRVTVKLRGDGGLHRAEGVIYDIT